MSVKSEISVGVKFFSGIDYSPSSSISQNSTHYDEWANSYDWDMLDMGYRLHEITSSVLMENMENGKEEDCFVLDVGCGTGFVGSALRKKGMRGILHGVDANDSMLDIADRKRVYDDLYVQRLEPGERVQTTDDLLYDGLTCVAAIGSNDIDPKILPDLVKNLKTGGIAVFTVQNHPRDAFDREMIEEEIQELIERKIIMKISESEEFYFNQGRKSRVNEMIATCTVHCYVKM